MPIYFQSAKMMPLRVDTIVSTRRDPCLNGQRRSSQRVETRKVGSLCFWLTTFRLIVNSR